MTTIDYETGEIVSLPKEEQLAIARLEEFSHALEAIDDLSELNTFVKQAQGLVDLCRMIDASRDTQNKVAKLKTNAQQRLGRMIPAWQADGRLAKRGSRNQHSAKSIDVTMQTLADFSITRNQSSQYQAMGRLSDEDTALLWDEVIASGWEWSTFYLYNKTQVPHVSRNSGEDEWGTPPDIIKAARAVMQGIDLDPASNKRANAIVRASTYYDKEIDGLSKKWFGRVWLNPPYSRGLIGKFSAKLIGDLPNIHQAIVLVNNATETNWFQPMLESANAICFPKGRISFLSKTGQDKSKPLQGQAILYFGKNSKTFSETFSEFGCSVWLDAE